MAFIALCAYRLSEALQKTILSDVFLVVWLVRLVVIRKRYYRINILFLK